MRSESGLDLTVDGVAVPPTSRLLRDGGSPPHSPLRGGTARNVREGASPLHASLGAIPSTKSQAGWGYGKMRKSTNDLLVENEKV